MISAQVKGIYTAEMDELERYVPEFRDEFSVWLRVLVGPRGTEGEESFDVNVCTPRWLERRVHQEGFVIGTHRLIVSTYDPAQIRTVLVKLIEGHSGDTWAEVAHKVGTIGLWEFEDRHAAL